jgi:CRP-like cAMP-binding protein
MGDKLTNIFVNTGMLRKNEFEHTLEPGVHARLSTQILKKGDVFGWAALLEKTPRRLAKAVCLEATEIVRISGDELLRLLATDPDIGDVVMSLPALRAIRAQFPHARITVVKQWLTVRRNFPERIVRASRFETCSAP